MQPQGQVQLLASHLGFGMELQAAVDAPRFRHLEGARVALEPGFPEGTVEALAEMGHRLVPHHEVAFGGAQAVLRDPEGWVAASDHRKDGNAAGY